MALGIRMRPHDFRRCAAVTAAFRGSNMPHLPVLCYNTGIARSRMSTTTELVHVGRNEVRRDGEQDPWLSWRPAAESTTDRVKATLPSKRVGLPPLSWYDVLYGLRRARGAEGLRPGTRRRDAARAVQPLAAARPHGGGRRRSTGPYPGDRRRQWIDSA
jgi:hypothetical protein